jgi:chromosome segregation ATPase
MNRRLQWLNLAGVLVLAVVCALQWRRDRAVNLELNGVEEVRLEQQTRLAEQEHQIAGLSDDLATFKTQLTRTQDEAAELHNRLTKAERENLQLTSDCEQLRQSVTNWAAAVALRDERLATANERIRELAGELNVSIQKFNALASNYNAVVDDLNALRAGRANQTNTHAGR